MCVSVSSLCTFSFVDLVFPCVLFILCVFLLRNLPTTWLRIACHCPDSLLDTS